MKYSKLNKYDVINGTGVRVSLFVSGCPLHCEGCFNPEAQDYNYGKEFTDKTLDTLLKYMKDDKVVGLSILGGEPMSPPNQSTVNEIIKKVKEVYPNKTIFCWTGYTVENLLERSPEITREILSNIDCLIDGPFVLAEKDLRLKWRGSRNQRVLNKQELEKMVK